jgi:hypothetical protein
MLVLLLKFLTKKINEEITNNNYRLRSGLFSVSSSKQTFERLIKETVATKTLQALRGLKVFIKK